MLELWYYKAHHRQYTPLIGLLQIQRAYEAFTACGLRHGDRRQQVNTRPRDDRQRQARLRIRQNSPTTSV